MQNNLRENYEDALLAMLMDEYAEEEGKRLMDEAARLNADPTFELPEGFEDRCMETIRKEFRRQRWAAAGRMAKKIAVRAAVIVIVCGFLSTVLYCTVDAFRAAVHNVFLNTREEYTSITTAPDESSADLDSLLLPTWNPDGYTENIVVLEQEQIIINYISDQIETDVIIFCASPSTAQINVDTEDADSVNHSTFLQHDALLIKKGTENTFAWIDETNGFSFVLWTNSESEHVLKAMAESIYNE